MASEACNGLDDDCDGETDEGVLSTYHADQDGDGYGNPSESTLGCTPPPGFVDAASGDEDCDDANPDVHPRADEHCDGHDDDCDGITDEPDAVDASTWYADLDGDGYGNRDLSTGACGMPDGYVATSTDCDDEDDSIHPLAAEACNGLDDDCNGETDEGVLSTYHADQDGDGYGNPLESTLGCTPPPGFVEAASGDEDCDDTDSDVSPGAYERCDGHDDDCDGATDEPDAVDASTWYTDFDGDGYGSLDLSTRACGAPGGYVATSTDCDDEDASIHPLAAEACNSLDDDCDGETDEGVLSTYLADRDGDGFGTPLESAMGCTRPPGFVDAAMDDPDCDDGRSDVHPGATEVCNDLDDDCDGTTDPPDSADASTWYVDTDGDGYGDALEPSTACDSPVFHVPDGTDCDDHEDDTWPGAPETCNGSDDDCDGEVDEDAVDVVTWYVDADGDGWGAGDPVQSCAPSSPSAVWDGDCDDTRADVNLLATEVCNGVDDDCDGVADNSLSPDLPILFADADGDGYGDPSLSLRTCASASGWVSDGTDCDDTVAAVHPGVEETCGDLVDENCDATDCPIPPEATLGGDFGYLYTPEGRYDRLGYGVDGGGDIDGDGFDDVVLAALGWNEVHASDAYFGAIYYVLGSSRPVGYNMTYAPVRYTSSEFLDVSDVAVLGDVDGDGFDDVLAGGYWYGYGKGAAYLFFGGPSLSDGTFTEALRFEGVEASSYTGHGIAGGDLDGDGLSDLLIGAYNRSALGWLTGIAYVVQGGPDLSSRPLSDADAILVREGSDQALGLSVSVVSDVDGDGLDDALLGAPTDDGRGAAHLLLGQDPISGMSMDDPDATFTGAVADGSFGVSVSGTGDVNGDGHQDMLFGASYANAQAGYAYLVLGAPGFRDMDIGTGADARFDGESQDAAGSVVAGAGDMNADGFDDMLICGYNHDDGAGVTYLVLGSEAPTGLSLSDADGHYSGDPGSWTGYPSAGAGDVNADGYDDIILGALYSDISALEGGAAWLILGTGQ